MTNQDSSTHHTPLEYQDFNLRFGCYDEITGAYKVWVEGQTPSGGSMKPENAAILHYDPKYFWMDPLRGMGGLVGDLDKRSGWSIDRAYELGAVLADLALPAGEVRNLFEDSLSIARHENRGLRLRLRIDALPLAGLPWEFLCLPQASGERKPTDFLALRREVSIVRTDTVESSPPALPERGRVRLAAVLSSPSGLVELDVSKDQEAITQAVTALRQAAGKDLVDLVWARRPATLSALQEVLQEGADIFHFGGHGDFNLIDQKGKILLEREDYSAEDYDAGQLAQLLRSAGVRLAMLGACDSGRRDSANVWSGIAPALTREHIPAVIANQFRIRDTTAILVAAKVYHRILAGFTVDEALFEARQAIFQSTKPDNRDWGTPVLYLREENGILFPLSELGKRPVSQPDGEAASPFIEVANTFRRVEGNVVDVMIGEVTAGTIRIRDEFDFIAPGTSVTTLKIDHVGD